MNVQVPAQKVHDHTKMTGKCRNGIDVQKLNSARPCGSFDIYLTNRAQSGQKLEYAERDWRT